jgi:hypothetical protein
MRDFFRRIPLFGGLVGCDWSDHWDSLGQTFVIVILSMAPVWLATLVIYATGPVMGTTAFWCALHSTISHGELFMYSTALLAPIFWIALADPPGATAFPSKISHMVLIGVIYFISAVFFGLTVAKKPLNEPFTFRLSVYIFSFAVALLYLGTVYHLSRLPDAAGEYRRQEENFADAVREHRQ